MARNVDFDKLVAAGKSVGEIIAIERFLIKVKGLQPVNNRALVMFEDGSKGFVQHVFEDYVSVLHLGNKNLSVGMTVVEQHSELVTKAGKGYIGRVISVTGEPLDGKGPIVADAIWPVFSPAPMLYKRELLDTQLETGVTVLDSLFPLLRGQRIALLGDSKSGKTTLAIQTAINQRNTDAIVIYVLIAKSVKDIDSLITQLEAADALKNTIILVSTLSESLALSYLAPYVGCSMGEFLWQKLNQDVIVIYDDLTSHAQAYREIALLSGISPGRESYPGDMFYSHSSLLERAGKISDNHKSLTAVPLVLTPDGDITAYLPTNIMSITDGQWILDMQVFRNSIRPAVNVGLSVTRVGGRGQNTRQKNQGVQALKYLSAYDQAVEFSHFGSEMAGGAQKDLTRGNNLYGLFTQKANETYSLTAQQLMLDIVLNLGDDELVDIATLKSKVKDFASKMKDDSDFDKLRDQLKAESLVKSTAPKAPQTPQAPPKSEEAKT
ncbi:MAG TPA: sodium-transporting two-sector ATPase [Candidatus Saccharimonadales bacterium]|nr:sodium-transporting two-sector ATPase [Candidatus Saccharimonadales bacterium]